MRGAGLVWDTLDATIVLGQDIIQPAHRTLPTSNAPHPAPSIHASRGNNHPYSAVACSRARVSSGDSSRSLSPAVTCLM